MIRYIKFCWYLWKTLYQQGLVDGRRAPSRAEIKAEWIAFNRGEERIAPIGTSGRCFQVKPKIKTKIKKIRKYTKATDSWEDIEVND